jgi:UDP-N-acetylglucosamine 2-epimerase (non-hydrolysing)
MEESTQESKKIAVIIGARPNFVKAAAFLAEAKKRGQYKVVLIHTGQHFDKNMSDVFLNELEIPMPDVFLKITGEFHTERLGRSFNSLQAVLCDQNYAACVVFGDVNSSLAGALAASKGGIPLLHIEAGLRSHDRRMPEEINRVIIDHLSKVLFTTEASATENLLREGIQEKSIVFVGNLMIETLEKTMPKILASDVLDRLNIAPREYVVATIHRQENIDDLQTLKTILTILQLVRMYKPVIFPMHPHTKSVIESYGLANQLKDLTVVDPLGYVEFIRLIQQSSGVVTDSGGIQEETSHLGIPCATLRDSTERPITVDIGTNKLFGIQIENISGIIAHLKRDDFTGKNIPYWDNQVSSRIFDYLDTAIL